MHDELRIHPVFSKLCRKLTAEEFSQLEANCLEAGQITDWIVRWRDFLCDGHNRLTIAKKHNLSYQVRQLDPTWTENQVVDWIIHNQLGRRNNTAEEQSYLRGKLMLAIKEQERTRQPGGQLGVVVETAEKLAKQTNTSKRTLSRDAAKSAAMDALPDYVSEGIRSGKFKATEKAILAAAEVTNKSEVFRPLRTGQGTSLDQVLRHAKVKTKPDSKPADKPKKSRVVEVSTAKLADQLTRKFISPLVRGLANLGKANGVNTDGAAAKNAKGTMYERAYNALNELIAAVKEMRSGKK